MGAPGVQRQGGRRAGPRAGFAVGGANAAGATGSDQGASTAPRERSCRRSNRRRLGFGRIRRRAPRKPGAVTSSFGAVVRGSQARARRDRPARGAGWQTVARRSRGDPTGQSGSNNTIFGNTGVGGQTFGGGAIVGVASKDKENRPFASTTRRRLTMSGCSSTARLMDTASNTLLRGPFNGQTYGGAQIGTAGR